MEVPLSREGPRGDSNGARHVQAVVNMQMDMSRYGEFRMDYNSLITDLDRAIEQQYALLCKHENNQTESKQHEESQNGQGDGSPHA